MRKIEPTGQFKRDYKGEAKGQHRATLDADMEPVFEALASDPDFNEEKTPILR